MSIFLQITIILDAIFFLLYGLQCFMSPAMALEFKRFGLPDSQRLLTGALQLLGSAGLVTGLFVPVIGIMASGGLAIMMIVAFLVRMKIKDGFWESAPSLLFLVLNGWISWKIYIQYVS